MKRSKTIRGIRRDRRVEVCRSFSYKLNAGNYESRDFFCSEKSECSIDDAPDVGAMLYQFCKAQVLQSVREYIAEMNAQRARKQGEAA